MRYDKSWEDLGGRIREEVDRAINSHDFQNMARNIRQTVETVVDLGGEAVRKAGRTVQETPKPVSVRHLYGSTGGMTAWGVAKILLGLGTAAFSGLSLLGGAVMEMLIPEFAAPIALFSAGAVGGGLLSWSGIRNIAMVNRFKAYRRLLGTKTTCALSRLAPSVGKNVKFVREDLGRMFGKGLFREGHLDNEGTMLITSHETFRQFEQARLQLEENRRRQAAEAANAPDPQIREVLDKGSAFLAQLRKCNDDIPCEEVSAKIYHMELIVERIFARAGEHPEVIPDLKKLMDYYLPMTVKLLGAYADMDAQPVQGGNIENAKKEIEGTLDTLNRAFEKLLDDLFQDTAMDVSSDITVLQTMLAQEGLTDDELTKLRKQSQ